MKYGCGGIESEFCIKASFSLQQMSGKKYYYKSWWLMRWFRQPILISQIINKPTHYY